MITQEDVRIFLQDYKEINKLIKSEEFSPEEINLAINFTINEFNEIPPFTNLHNDAETFPFPALLLLGTVSYLLKGKGLSKARNRLAYSTDGVSIDDQSMSDVYLQMGSNMSKEFQMKASTIKKAENIRQGFSHVSSEYRCRFNIHNLRFR